MTLFDYIDTYGAFSFDEIDSIQVAISLDIESRNMLYGLLNVFIRAIEGFEYRDFMEFVKKFKLDI